MATHTTVKQFYADTNATAEAAKAEARRLQEAKRQAIEAAKEWHATYEAGLTPDQAQWLADMAEQMREANAQANRTATPSLPPPAA